MKTKILQFEILVKKVRKFKEEGKKIVYCHGVFDLLHIGHIKHLHQAQQMGDILVVTITPDKYVDKGPNRPAFPEMLRAEALASLQYVDFVSINRWPTAKETLVELNPDFFVKGSEFKNVTDDMTGKIGEEAKVAEKIGSKVAFTEDIVFSSSNLINRYLSNYPEEVNEYLKIFRNRYPLDVVLDAFEQMKKLRVLVLGDTILDEYHYCNVIGKSSKDPVLAAQYKSHDVFAGGVLAVANHISDFVESVKLVTVLGEQNSQEEFIRSQLAGNVTPHFQYQSNAPTIVKRRFLDRYSFQKLFEIYIMDGSGLKEEEEEEFCAWLRKNLPQYDLVIATDYGHGAIESEVRSALYAGARFLAVNTQANAGNRGFHTISKYQKADYISIAEHEAHLEVRDVKMPFQEMIESIRNKVAFQKFVITQGRQGCSVIDNDGEFIRSPSLTTKIVDRIGAGDAFFSISSLAAFLDLPLEVLAFIGNVAGALSVGSIGNKRHLTSLQTKKFIVSLLK